MLVLLACLGVTTFLAFLVADRDHTITELRTALRNPANRRRHGGGTGWQADSSSAMFTLPDAGSGSFSVVAVAVRPGSGSAPVTWLFVHGQRADPGQRYGLLEGTCGGQYVTASDLADGRTDRHGDLTITAQDIPSAAGADDWIALYRWEDGAPGRRQGPERQQAKTFRSTPPR